MIPRLSAAGAASTRSPRTWASWGQPTQAERSVPAQQ